MHTSISLASLASLFVAMIVLAAVPSVSVLTVLAHSASSGFLFGALAAAGIVVGDVIYLLIAIFGLELITTRFSGVADALKYLGAFYLFWLGARVWHSQPQANIGLDVFSSALSSFLSGLLLTLADYKVVLFYLGFLPAFVDIASMRSVDVLLIVAVTVVAVGGVKLAYAATGRSIATRLGSDARTMLMRGASITMIGVGSYVLLG